MRMSDTAPELRLPGLSLFPGYGVRMILSDQDIYTELLDGGLSVTPPSPLSAFQPASLEVHLADALTRSHEEGFTEYGQNHSVETWWLEPGEFALGSTVETLVVPSHLCAQVNGKSSLGRLGLLVHATAGFIDPGFQGQVTLELKNLSNRTIALHKLMPVAQLVFHRLSSPAQRPYGHPELESHYQHQTGTTRSYMDGSSVYGSVDIVP